MERAENW